MVCPHLCPLLCQLHPTFMCSPSDIHSYIHTSAEGKTWLVKEAELDQRSVSECVCACESEQARVSRREQLPLAVSAAHPGLTAARNMRPLQTSVLGKKDGTAHTLRKAFVSALSLILPHSPTHTKKKECRLSMLIHSFSHK